ncbi:MAG: hypothetical protein V3T05_01295 [Myxococcota bacterium]
MSQDHHAAAATYFLLALSTACTGGGLVSIGSDLSGQETPKVVELPTGMTMHTRIENANAVAGETVIARCYLRKDDDFFLPDTEVTVIIEPAPDSVDSFENSISFVATVAGSYRVACQMADGSASDPTGSRVQVSPDLPFSWHVDLPDQDCFSQIDYLPIDYEVFDFYGNRIEDALVDTVIIPSDGVERDAFGALRFTQEGDYDLTVSLVGAVDPRANPAPYAMNVRVDSSAPEFFDVTPERGAMLQVGGNEDYDITVAGTVTDRISPIASLEVGGVAIPVSGANRSEAFDATQASRWGLSIVSGRAVDACGNVATLAQAYMRSPSFASPSTYGDPAARIDAGFTVQLNQVIVDDHDRTDIDDLATLVETVLSNYDYDAVVNPGAVLVASPARDDCSGCGWGGIWVSSGYTVRRHPDAGRRIELQGPTINALDIVDGGVNFNVSANNFAFPLRFQVTTRSCSLGCEGDTTIAVSATVGFSSLQASGTLGVTYLNGDAKASLTSLSFNVQGAYLDVSCGILDGVCDAITDEVIDAAVSRLEAGLTDALSTMVPPVLESALRDFHVETSLDLPPPMDMTLGVVAGLDWVLFCGPYAGLPTPSACPSGNAPFAQQALYAQFFPTSRGHDIPSDARGAIVLGSSDPTFSATDYGFGIAVKDDLLNQLLWSLWYGGGLSMPDLTSILGPDAPAGMALSMSATLPPVIMPGRNGSELDIGFGDMYVDFTADLNALTGGTGEPYIMSAGIYVSMVIGVSLDVDPTTNKIIAIFDVDPHLEVAHIDDPISQYHGLLSELVGAALRKLMPQLVGDALGAMELPELDLSGVAGLPNGTVWRLQNADLSHEAGNIKFTGSLGS